jgi:hypothetical protein
VPSIYIRFSGRPIRRMVLGIQKRKMPIERLRDASL